MTMAAGMAAGGMRPVVAIYSTFLQRAYDQVLHDICLQCLPVVIAVDRAGIVGEDGETHQGIYDLSLLLPMPGLEIFCPPDYRTLQQNLTYALSVSKPVAIRYPRGKEWPEPLPDPIRDMPSQQSVSPSLRPDSVPSGTEGHAELPDHMKVHCLRRGTSATLAVLGSLAGLALKAATLLAEENIDLEVLSIVCAKPFDIDTLIDSVSRTGNLVMVEEALSIGGLAQCVLPQILAVLPRIKFRQMGIEDHPLCQGSRDQLLRLQRLDAQAMAAAVRELLATSSPASNAPG
jgi:1-deoxy-D-xylulose-5-phosphate synthase